MTEYQDWQLQTQKRRRRLLSVLLILLIIILLLVCGLLYYLFKPGVNLSPADTNGISWIHSIYGFGSEPDQLHHPSDVAVAPGGDSFWVADVSNFRLIEYYMNGTLKRVVTHDSKGQSFNYPNRIAVAPNGWIYVAEQTYNHVLVYDPDFNLQQTLLVEMPISLAVNNEVLVVGSRGGFGAYQRDGYCIGSVGSWGNGPDQFDVIGALALDSENNVYVLDTYNDRLSKYDGAGDKVWMVNLGQPGNTGVTGGRSEDQAELVKKYPGNLQMPMGLTLDGAGRCVVVDLFDFSAAAFDSKDGAFIKKWGEYGRQDGFLNYPSALVYNRHQDSFIVAESSLGRVQIISLEGSSESPLPAVIRNFGDLLKACCLPVLIILVVVALYGAIRRLVRRKNERNLPDERVSNSLAKGGDTHERDE
jgi:DNA-binding beta-propeller fold protein YncE